MDPNLLVGIFSAVFGLGQIGIAAWPYFKNLTEYEALNKALQNIQRTAPKSRLAKSLKSEAGDKSETYWNHLVEWLNYGEIILAPLKRHITIRLIALTGLVLVLSSLIPMNIEKILLPNVKGSLGIQDLILFVAVGVTPYLGFLKRFVLDDDEKKFLENFSSLNEEFYKHRVRPRIEDFNYEFETYFKQFRDEKDYSKEIQYLETMIAEVKNRLDELRKT